MSKLIAICFDSEGRAEEARREFERMQNDHVLELEDYCIAEHEPSGKVHLHQFQNMTKQVSAFGGFWGMLVGAMFANPLVGLLAGAGLGAAAGKRKDIGIDDDFMRKLGASLPPGSSALFLLVKRADPKEALRQLAGIGGTLLTTDLSTEQEQEIQRALNAES